MRRGDVVTIATFGDYGKPRPAMVVQADPFEALPSVTVLPMTSEIHGEHLIRVSLAPTKDNGLQVTSQVMIDKATTVPTARVGEVIGRVGAESVGVIDRALGRFLGLAAA